MYPEIDPTAHIQRTVDSGKGGAFSLNMDTSQDNVLAIRFFIDTRKNNQESKKQGRLVCDDVEMVEIRIPGGSDIIRREVGDEDRERFTKQYQAFRAGMSQDKASGTPLAEWPLMTRAQVEEAGYFGVRTVEAMAHIQDSHIMRMGPGWKDIRTKALNWLQQAKDGALLSRLQDELGERDRRIDALEKMLQTQGKEIEAARAAGGALSPLPVVGPDSLVTELAKQVAALQLASAATNQGQQSLPKKRGWPKGKPRKPILPPAEP